MPKRVPLVEFDALGADLKLWFLALFNADIRQARHFASDALKLAARGQDDQDPNSWYCRSHDAAIVRYSRCFLACNLPDGAACTRLPRRYYFDSPPLSLLHERTIELRHGIVAHADMRHRQFTLTKNHADQDKPDRWRLTTSSANFPPESLALFASLCGLHTKRVVAELLPLVDGRLERMEVGERIVLGQNIAGDVHWLP